jgi:phosphatidylcholine synthase
MLTLPVALAWVGLAAWAAWADFAQPAAVTLGLIVTSAYLLLAGVAQQVLYRETL